MKTLLLTSGGMDVQAELLKILPKPAHQMKIAQIITASKPEPEAAFYIKKDHDAMAKLGFKVTDIDIETQTIKQLEKTLANFDIICVQGGNTFYLLKAVRESGFDQIIEKLINEGKIYMGISAGSIIMCPTIETSGWKGGDRNEVGLTDLTGLALVPFNIFVHYEPKWQQIVQKESAKSKYPTRLLTNSQAFLVQNDQVTLVGEQPETKI